MAGMREIILYGVSAVAWLVILGYSIHIFVGGLVSPATERWMIAAAELIGLAILAALARNIIQQRRRR